MIVISIEDSQIRWNVLSMSFSERESGKWPLGLSDFYHNCLISNDCTQHSGKISRVFPRPFTHGGGEQVQGDKALMGQGTHEGGHRPYGRNLSLIDYILN